MHFLAPLLDALCLSIFVLAGRQSHGLDSGAGWFLTILWPIALGWFTTAVVAGLYRRRRPSAVALATTVVVGIGLGLVIRVVVAHRDAPIAFVAVAYGFITLTTLGWRAVARALPLALSRRRG